MIHIDKIEFSPYDYESVELSVWSYHITLEWRDFFYVQPAEMEKWGPPTRLSDIHGFIEEYELPRYHHR